MEPSEQQMKNGSGTARWQVPRYRFFSVEEPRTIEAICVRILPQDDRPQSRDVPDSFLKRPLFCHPTVTSPDDSESASGRVRGSERASLTEDRTT